MHYIKQLDALRALAVILVIISHWFVPSHFLNRITGENGTIGVTFFFVLSGFLITGILLGNKNSKQDKSNILKNFYIRRSLRIFPVYYLTIILAYLFFSNFIKGDESGNLPYYLLYSSNILVFLKQSWVGSFSPLWSLAVEEQFYLIWPWAIIFVPKRYTLSVIIASVLGGIASYYLLPLIFPYSEAQFLDKLTPSCFDSFGLGGLLAYFNMWRRDLLPKFKQCVYFAALPASLLFVMYLYFGIDFGIPFRTIVSFLSLALITYVLQERNNLFYSLILNNRVLILLGKFSYGLYLFHNFVPAVYGDSKILLPTHAHYGKVLILEYCIILVLLSYLSWRFIETPINQLKHHFSYKDKMNKKEIAYSTL